MFMNVLFDVSHIFASKGGGVYSYLIKLLPALLARIEAERDRLIFFQSHLRPTQKQHSALKESKLFRFRFPVKLLNEMWLKLSMPDLSWFYKNIDIVHSPHFSLPVCSSARKVLTVDDITYLKHPEYFSRSGRRINDYFYKKLLPVNIKRADSIIAISQFTKDDIIEYFGIEKKKIHVVHLGNDAPSLINEMDLNAQLKKFGLKKSRYIYFPVGTIEPRKNISSTMEAFLKAVEDPIITLVMSGIGKMQDIERISMHRNVKLVYWKKEIEKNALYQGALFVVYPSLYEGFGLPVVEAMGNRKAVLTSNTTALKEIAEGYAHTVNPHCLEEIEYGFTRLMEDEPYRRRLELLSEQRAHDFTWQKMAGQVYAVYRSLCYD